MNKRIFDGTQYRDMTPEEEAELERQRREAEEAERNAPPTPEERVSALEVIIDDVILLMAELIGV